MSGRGAAEFRKPTRERVLLLDALRGFALFGVLLVNLRDLTLFNFLSGDAQNLLATARIDRWLNVVMAALVDAKAFTIFTVLFGIGFAMQAEQAAAANANMKPYLRRLTILLLIGSIHAYLFWWGDILRFYAVLGFLLLPLRSVRPPILAGLGIVVAVVLTPLLRPVMATLLPQVMSSETESAAALFAFQSNDWRHMLRENFLHDVWSRTSAWGLPFYVLGRLLIGAALGRSGMLADSNRYRHLWIRMLIVLLPLGSVLTVFVLLRDYSLLGETGGWWRTESAHALIRVTRSAASLALGLAYVSIFVVVFDRVRWLSILAPVGRMALTNYLLQTVIGLELFYGIGLGIGPRFGLVGIVVTGIGLFAGQVMLSHWWLKRFHFGPVEWLWRSFTYEQLQPMRRG